MESPFKVKKNKTISIPTTYLSITFQVHKHTKFGQAVFVCGNLPELGSWDPLQSLRLQWSEGNIWRGVCTLPKDISKQVEFKFIITQWNLKQDSRIQWQVGPNRTIDTKLLLSQSTYTTQWNKQLITLCLRTHSLNNHKNLYYVTGSIDELGGWKQEKIMQTIEVGFKNKMISLIKGDPSSLNQPQISSYKVLSFYVNRNLQKFHYYYSRWGQTAQTQNLPGRMIDMHHKFIDQESRLADFEYLGQRIIIDQSSFDDLLFQRMNNNIYLASSLKNVSQFNKLKQKHITAIIHLQNSEQPCSIGSSRVKVMCKENGVFFKNWVVQNIRNSKFISQAQEIIIYIQKLLVEGHRVCLHCSKKILREVPIKLLYLTLLGGHSFQQATQQVQKQVPLSEGSCQVASNVLQLVTQKINRGKSIVYDD